MLAGSFVQTGVTVPGLGIKLNIAMFRDLLFRANGINGCEGFRSYLANRAALKVLVTQQLAKMLTEGLGLVPGISCNSDPAVAVLNALNLSVGSGGLAVSVNTEALAQEVLCRIIQGAVSASSVLDRPANTIADALLTICNDELGTSDRVAANGNFSLVQAPEPTPEPPALVQENQPNSWLSRLTRNQPAVQSGPGQIVSTKKRSYTPLVVASGVAVIASSVILFHRR